MKYFSPTVFTLLGFVIVFSQSLQSQDSTSNHTSTTYSSFGFQGSFVSGIGLTYGRMLENRTQAKVTGGVITSDGNTIFATGFDFNYSLSNQPNMRIFIGPSFGVYGGSKELPRFRMGLGTGIEIPLTGVSLLQSISVGAVVYYPTYFFLSKSVGFAGSIYLVYNFK